MLNGLRFLHRLWPRYSCTKPTTSRTAEMARNQLRKDYAQMLRPAKPTAPRNPRGRHDRTTGEPNIRVSPLLEARPLLGLTTPAFRRCRASTGFCYPDQPEKMRPQSISSLSPVSDPALLTAISLTSFSALLLELALTRLFSVVLFYHFAFLAIAVALLGLGAGGVFAYLCRNWLAGKLPLGFTFRADQGKVALTRGDLGSNHWRHSYAAGLTLRAGGFPQVYLLFAFGGTEGTHTLVNMNTSLLGTASRPSLF
jgi:hypothetical protein